MVHRNTAAECLRLPLSETLPTKCQQLKKGFGECRRGMIDMRKRFRGNQPITFKTLETSENSGEGYQLYAGKSAFSGAPASPTATSPSRGTGARSRTRSIVHRKRNGSNKRKNSSRMVRGLDSVCMSKRKRNCTKDWWQTIMYNALGGV